MFLLKNNSHTFSGIIEKQPIFGIKIDGFYGFLLKYNYMLIILLFFNF